MSLPLDVMVYDESVAVLASGGLDSAVLIGELAHRVDRVIPLHVRFGLHWEADEEAALRRYLGLLASSRVASLEVFELPLEGVYNGHWSTTGIGVPGCDSHDSAVELPGRNLFQLVQPAVWCHLEGIRTIALGTLEMNPFSDATPEFFAQLERTLNLSLGGRLRIIRPYERLGKRDILLRGRGLPLEATLSCLQPLSGGHCGDCNKCGERRRGFAAAGLVDPTPYAADRAQPV